MKDRFKGLNGDLFNSSSEISLPSAADKAPDVDAEAEAVSALVALGYKPQEASRMVSKNRANRSTKRSSIAPFVPSC